MSKVSIEYAHIYTDQQFSNQHRKSIELLRLHLKKSEHGKNSHKVVLIDDYSPPTSLERFNLKHFFGQLHKHGVSPDTVVAESALVPYCQKTLDLIQDKKIKKGLKHYYKTRQKYPCSLFVASWYLLRLGAFGQPKLNTLKGLADDLLADRLVSILPESFTTPEKTAQEIIQATKFRNFTKRIEHIFFEHQNETYSPWQDFDAEEYLTRNYLSDLLYEDAQLIKFAIDHFKKTDIQPRSQRRVADIGTGPNLYPSLLISPLLHPSAELDLIEYAPQNITYLHEQLQRKRIDYDQWGKFINHMKALDWQPIPSRVQKSASVKKGSIFTLPDGFYDMVVSFFVSESITSDKKVFARALKNLIAALKPKGHFVTAHMIGSNGYFAGERTFFPAVNVNIDELESIYSQYADFSTYIVDHKNHSAARKGYSGMALFVGQKHG